MSLDTFVRGIEAGVGAPATLTNRATFIGWSAQEKGAGHPAPPDFASRPVQWNNLMNTTHPWPGAVDVNAKGVKQYRTEQDGIDATVATLLEPVAGVLPHGYDAIVNRLRHSLPARFWGDTEVGQLSKWGTGGIWLPFVPLQGDSPVEELINRIWATVGNPLDFSPEFSTAYAAYIKSNLRLRLDAIDKQLTAIKNSGVAVDFKPVLDAIATSDTDIDTALSNLSAQTQKIGAALKQGLSNPNAG
jgi:hypothetical protein